MPTPTRAKSAGHSTRTKAHRPDNRFSSPGRVTDDLRSIIPRDKDVDATEVNLEQRVRVWFEGDVVIPEWDEEAHVLKDQLPDMLARLGKLGDKTICTGLVMRVQVVPLEGQLPNKKHARRTSRRYTQDEVLTFLYHHQGATILQIIEGLFPNYPAPALLEPRIRMTLHRLSKTGQISQKKERTDRHARWFTQEKVEPAWTKRAKALAYEMCKLRGGHPTDYEQEATALEIVIDANRKATSPAQWTHPDDQPF